LIKARLLFDKSSPAFLGKLACFFGKARLLFWESSPAFLIKARLLLIKARLLFEKARLLFWESSPAFNIVNYQLSIINLFQRPMCDF
jgi:hypothetical protein